MTTADDCNVVLDDELLVREGADRPRRSVPALDPAAAPVDERRPEHAMVFASQYAEHLRYVDLDGNLDGDWRQFFASDLSARIAVAAVDDVDGYRTLLKGWLRRLEDPPLPPSVADMVAALHAVFDAVGSLARAIDALATGLPPDHRLRATLSNLIRGRLSPMLRRLIAYYLAGQPLGVIDPTTPRPAGVRILGRRVVSFHGLVSDPARALSADWAAGSGVADWAAYVAVDPTAYASGYGPSAAVVDQANHLATHHLFSSACDTFLAAHAGVVSAAGEAIADTFEWDGHEPHYALFMAFLDLLGHSRDQANTLTGRHLDFYYRDVLRLAERPAEPEHAHVLVELAKHVTSHRIAAGTLLRAGKDAAGQDVHFAVDRDLVANRASVVELRSAYRHRDTSSESLAFADSRIYASPVAASGDGVGGPPTTADGSWHPFANKSYQHGALTEIRMAPAEVGFVVASHLLWLREGDRDITLLAEPTSALPWSPGPIALHLQCTLTTEDGWLEQDATVEVREGGTLAVSIALSGEEPPITPYDPAVHGGGYDTAMPLLVVRLRHVSEATWDYDTLAGIEVEKLTVAVAVEGLTSVAISNDHGPVDPAKPFLPYGSTPRRNSALVIGSNEVFGKSPSSLTLRAGWMTEPVAHGDQPEVEAEVLSAGKWTDVAGPWDVDQETYVLGSIPSESIPRLVPDTTYTTGSRSGFVRLRLDGGFGTDTYPVDLAAWLVGAPGASENQPTAPVLPLLESLRVDYTAEKELIPDPADGTGGRFFHLTPFGHVEQAVGTGSGGGSGGGHLSLLPRFETTQGEEIVGALYLGVRDLAPPQTLTLLAEVVDGSANPLVAKPETHLDWSYLRGDEWVAFGADAVADETEGLLTSGILTMVVPDDASTDHSLLPHGLHWFRVAVSSAPDAVSRLVRLDAQALRATYVAPGGVATDRAQPMPPGTIAKLAAPHPAIKGLTQPAPGYGGRPPETPDAFHTRASERLRHRDRAITMWDYEHLVLEAFPGIYQVRCLNHTRYEPTTGGTSVYRELAPGHVTVVTIPDLAVPSARDPLRPATSLGTLGEIERFLTERMSCFATLHVRNPRFEQVRVGLSVRLRDGSDETFQVAQLREAITRHLSPWAYRSEARPSFNGRIAKSVVIDVVEELAYVDYVTDVRLTHLDPETGAESGDLDEVVGSRAVSILVSVPADQHQVTVLRPNPREHSVSCACAPGGDG